MRASAGPKTPVKETSEQRPREEWTTRLRRSAAEVLELERVKAITSRLGAHGRDLDSEATLPPSAVDEVPQTPTEALLLTKGADVGLVDLLNMSFDTMSALISRYRMASNPPDVLVTVPSNAVRTLDFHRAAEMIELGRELTEEALDHAGY
jgi:NTE family protein